MTRRLARENCYYHKGLLLVFGLKLFAETLGRLGGDGTGFYGKSVFKRKIFIGSMIDLVVTRTSRRFETTLLTSLRTSNEVVLNEIQRGDGAGRRN